MRMACVNVLVSTPLGFYRQMDGVAMGSPVAPQIANIFLSQFDKELSYRSKFYYWYVDDIFRTVKVPERPFLETHANTLHLNLKFTSELETEDGIAFLDLKVRRTGNGMECNWYRKSTDTGVTTNCNATTSNVYKSGLVAGFVHRIFNTTTNWNDFVNSFSVVENILGDNCGDFIYYWIRVSC